ncbi:unnamed protein product [Ceutorhynchus assimilis]|uniref:Bromo domain-containing protein n=1 Tax=Ceutorhynchus assimilis TaxID=467358 RepID=A0A9N9MSJ8_9CUCU|nr:unnamed protein product [Ceutorhynchus assimilis]
MVNTRRSESHSTRPHQTRGATKEEQDCSSSSTKEEDSNSEHSDDDSSTNTPILEALKKKVGGKVSKLVTLERKFPSKFDQPPKRISLERRRLAVYANKKMDEDFLDGDFSEEEYYPNRRFRQNRRQNHLTTKRRMLRRSALSLRPISQKSYADHSPIHFDTDSDGFPKRETRHSRNMEGRSWLGDSQMHKVGYPNLNAGYSEEDSRDAADVHANMEISPPSTRRLSGRRMVKPVYYYEEYDDGPRISRTRRTVRRVVTEVTLDHRRKPESNEKENREESGRNLRTRRAKAQLNQKANTEDDENKSSKESDAEEAKEAAEAKDTSDENVEEQKQNIQSQSSAGAEEVVPKRSPRQSKRCIPKVADSESSESEESGGKKYSLRNRPAKVAPKTMQTSVLRPTMERRTRRRFTRRRKSSSSSNTTSSSSDRVRKTPKSPHSKNVMMKTGGSSTIAPIKPETLDQSVRFNSIGGLKSHIRCLKEIILLPKMYPEVFRKFQVKPPRGVLLHGPPGTGKTLISRALANECSFGNQKVSFFMRKGADLLSKWIGESEKQLRLLFEQAAEMKPSIIFFDELDGLAPARSARLDQVHASVVSTLLALMDGLTDRGDIIVIGATNRIDAIDPALRRPGRFDRELFFPLPSKSEREEILKVHTCMWAQKPSANLLDYLAENTVGYCGADLRALCSEAVIQSFQRTYPQVYESEHRLLLDADTVKVEKVDFFRAKSMLVPSSYRVASGFGKKLLPILEPLLGNDMKKIFSHLEKSFPHGLNESLSKVKLSASLYPPQFLLTGNGSEHGQSNHIAPALLFRMEHIHPYLLDLATLFREPGRTPEEVCFQVCTEAKRNVPSIIYVPNIDHFWELTSDVVKAIFLAQIRDIGLNIPILVLATSNVIYRELPGELQKIFSDHRKEVLEVHPPNSEARHLFFKGLLIDTCLKPMRQARECPKTPPPLPRAPTPPPAPLTEDQAQAVYNAEEHTLRELRIFLRDMCKKLANNKLFFMFTKPVDTEEVPDYTEIIKEPMDLETMMMKVDFHRYECAKDFLHDIDLICQNALEYNPSKTSADKQIRHRACSLRDYAYTLIKTEMDSDFEDKCKDIKKKRKDRNACVKKYLPPYIVTPDVAAKHIEKNIKHEEQPSTSNGNINFLDSSIPPKTMERNRISTIRKRKFNNWRHGYLKKKKRPKTDIPNNLNNSSKSKEKQSSDESKENDPDSSTMELPLPENDSPGTAHIHTAISVTCDSPKAISSSSERTPNRVKADLLSPSELLENPLYFDDIDLALNENALEVMTPIDCSANELENVLDETVQMTNGFSLEKLLNLYNQFSCIIKKYSKTHLRQSLPKELHKELIQFRKSHTQ